LPERPSRPDTADPKQRRELSIATETELKLAAPASDMPKLRRALRDLAPGSACSRSFLTTTYYDTDDRALRRRGLSLRVREAAGRFVQTVKADGTDVLTRGEWEDEIAGAEPDLGAPHSGGRLPKEIAGALRPLFATAVTRTRIALAPSPSLCIEAAIDEGEIRGIGNAAAAPISEIELELKRGEPGALFDTALALLAAAPLHIETRSKSERGYAAIAGDTAPARPVRAAPVGLDPAMTVEAALQLIGRACLAHLLHNQAAALAGDPEGVHQMRVASRRLRSLIASLDKRLPASGQRWVSGELKRLDEILGPARNLDAFAGDLLPPARAAMPGAPALDRLAAVLGAARRSAGERIEELILSPRYTETMLRLLQWFETRGWRDEEASARRSGPIGDVAPRLLARCLERVRKRSKGFRRADAKRRHKLRIALKELRYTSELLGSLFDRQDVRSLGRRLKALQDSLGYANDVRVGREFVGELGAQTADAALAAAGERVLAWHEHRVWAAERKMRKRLRRLRRTAPFWKSALPARSAVGPPAAMAG
jgi:triphosphatase